MRPTSVQLALAGVALAALASVASAQATSAPAVDRDSSSEAADREKEKPRDKSTAATSTARREAGTAAAALLPLRLRAVAFDPNTPVPGSSTGMLDIVIERWSTDAERDQLRGVLQEKGGGDALLRAVQKIEPRAGFVRTQQSLGWDIQFARLTTRTDGVRSIVFGTDRPMSFREAANQPRSADYEFLVGEIRLREDGRGEGRLAPAAAVSWDDATRTIEIENYLALPVRLTDVRVVEQGKK
jgi:hypothetical protein